MKTYCGKKGKERVVPRTGDDTLEPIVLGRLIGPDGELREHLPLERAPKHLLDAIVAGRVVMRFNELVRLLEQNGFRLFKEKGSVRYYTKPGVDRLIRVDYHGAKEIPTGTCNAILKAAGLKGK